MGKAAGVVVGLIGLVILGAGACVIIKPEASAGNWMYREYSQGNPILSNIIETVTGGNPYEGDVIAQVGSYVIGIHHSLGIFDVAEASSADGARSTAQTAGLATAGVGLLILIVGGIVAGGGGEEKTVVVQKSEGGKSSS